MPLQLPTRREQRARAFLRMLGEDVALTDLTQIAAVRVFYEEACIEEWQALYAGLLREERDWFIQTAQGAALERRIADFGLARPAAQVASGYVTLTVSADGTVIPAGTALETAPTDGTEPKRYAVLANPDIPGGAWTLNQPGGRVRIAA
ncbi:MAG: baseplate J/gp47 family protein, partial [bacterium]